MGYIAGAGGGQGLLARGIEMLAAAWTAAARRVCSQLGRPCEERGLTLPSVTSVDVQPAPASIRPPGFIEGDDTHLAELLGEHAGSVLAYFWLCSIYSIDAAAVRANATATTLHPTLGVAVLATSDIRMTKAPAEVARQLK